MPQLANVTCKSCGLSGSVPPGWLQTLLQLVLPHNSISGPLYIPVGPPSRLRLLDLSYNQLSQIPSGTFWSSVTRLQSLSLQANTLVGPLSGATGRASSLAHLPVSVYDAVLCACWDRLDIECLRHHHALNEQIRVCYHRACLVSTYLHAIMILLVCFVTQASSCPATSAMLTCHVTTCPAPSQLPGWHFRQRLKG